MRKVMMSMIALLMAISMNAQSEVTPFEKGKFYANAGLSGFDLSYNSLKKWNMRIDAKLGYLFDDNWMALVEASYGAYHAADNELGIGVGVRYYVQDNGLYAGLGARYKHQGNLDDFIPNVNIGYTFFLSRTVTIEPELYYNISTNNFKDYSGLGLRIGFGIYLFKDQSRN